MGKLNFDELVKKEYFTDRFNAEYITEKIKMGDNWFELQLSKDKLDEVYTALE